VTSPAGSGFTGYFDASGKKDTGMMSVAGFLANVGKWRQFEYDWKILLARYDMQYFHMSDFMGSYSPFEEWRNESTKKENFLRTALEVIGSCVACWICASIRFTDFEKVDSMYQLSENFKTPYAFAARSCIAQANRWLRTQHGCIPADYVFDDGDEGQGALVDLLERINKTVRGMLSTGRTDDSAVYEIPIPSFKNSRDRQTELGVLPAVVPLQAADFAAWNVHRVEKAGPQGYSAFNDEWKWLRVLIEGIPHDIGKYDARDLERVCKEGRIAARSPS
jgi:hypothetical protein